MIDHPSFLSFYITTIPIDSKITNFSLDLSSPPSNSSCINFWDYGNNNLVSYTQAYFCSKIFLSAWCVNKNSHAWSFLGSTTRDLLESATRVFFFFCFFCQLLTVQIAIKQCIYIYIHHRLHCRTSLISTILLSAQSQSSHSEMEQLSSTRGTQACMDRRHKYKSQALRCKYC